METTCLFFRVWNELEPHSPELTGFQPPDHSLSTNMTSLTIWSEWRLPMAWCRFRCQAIGNTHDDRNKLGKKTSYQTLTPRYHYCDVIMGAIASQTSSLAIVYSTIYSDADQRKHQSFASLAFVRGIHRGPMNSPHKRPVTRKMFSFHDVIMMSYGAHPAHTPTGTRGHQHRSMTSKSVMPTASSCID